MRFQLFAAALALAATAPAAATSYVPMADAALVQQAELIVVGRIASVHERAADGRAVTRYMVDRLDLLKGTAPPRLQVTVLGGEDAAGRRLEIAGAPRFREGERAILFLNADRVRGGYQLTQFLLGAFIETASEKGPLAVRQLQGTDAVGGADPQALGLNRDFARFAEWIRGQAKGRAAVDYFVAARPLLPKFNLQTPARRWFEFDTGAEVVWNADATPEAATPGGGYLPFQRALQGWNADPGSKTLLVYGGKIANSTGFTSFDATNVILFNDPNGEIAGSFSCTSGGVLAIGGPWISSETRLHDGDNYRVIVGGDVITQDGAGCIFTSQGGTKGEQTFAHEIGHALGFNHSCGDGSSGSCTAGSEADEALMRASSHNDWRGAQLGFDDQDAAALVYGQPRRPALARMPDNKLAVLLLGSDGSSVSVRLANPATGAIASPIDFGSAYAPLAVAGLADVNANAIADIAVLGVKRSDGDVIVDVRDGATGALVASIASYDTTFAPIGLVAVPDQNANGKPEVALLASRWSDGAVRLETRDAATGALISRVTYTRTFRPLALRHYPDSNANGSDEVAVLGTVPTTGKLVTEVRELIGGALVGQPLAANAFRPEAMRETPASALLLAGDTAGDADAELGVIGFSTDTGKFRLEVDEAAAATTVLARNFASAFTNLLYAATVPADMDGNGELEVAYLVRRNDTGAIRAEVRDFATGDMVSTVNFNGAFYPEGLDAIADTNANGQPDLVMLGRNLSTNALRLEIRDGLSAALLRTITIAR